MKLTIKAKTFDVANFSEASAVFVKARGNRSRSFPDGNLFNTDGKHIAKVSFNGRVWSLDTLPTTLVYCPGSAHEDEGRPDIFNDGRESVWGRKCENPHAPGTLEARVFDLGATYAKSCYVQAA